MRGAASINDRIHDLEKEVQALREAVFGARSRSRSRSRPKRSRSPEQPPFARNSVILYGDALETMSEEGIARMFAEDHGLVRRASRPWKCHGTWAAKVEFETQLGFDACMDDAVHIRKEYNIDCRMHMDKKQRSSRK